MDNKKHNRSNKRSPREKWTEEEDKILLEKVEENGMKWSVIAKFLKDRSPSSVKNHFNVISRKIKNQEQISKCEIKLLPSDCKLIDYEQEQVNYFDDPLEDFSDIINDPDWLPNKENQKELF